MAAAEAFDGLLARLQVQHERFLADATSKTFQTLQTENRRLSEENAHLRSLLANRQPLVAATPGSVSTSSSNGDWLVTSNTTPAPPPTPPLGTGTPGALAVVTEGEGGGLRKAAAVIGNGHALAITAARDTPELGLEPELPGAVPSSTLRIETSLDDSIETVFKTTATLQVEAAVTIAPSTHLDEKNWAWERKRLRNLFRLDPDEDFVSEEDLQLVLAARRPTSSLTLAAVLEEFRNVSRLLPSPAHSETFSARISEAPPGGISLDILVSVLHSPDLVVLLRDDMVGDVLSVVRALQLHTVDEVIDEATRVANVRGSSSEVASMSRWERPLTVIVSVTVIVSLMAMGLSVDTREPDHPGWVLLEALCTGVFVAEAGIKIRSWGCGYFRGEAAYWNLTDLGITIISVLDVIITCSRLILEAAGGIDSQIASAARVTVMMRALRCARVVRLIKLLRSPLLRDLANMMVGFVIGIPSLVWVLCLFLVILYMIGLIFRQAFGPAPGQMLMQECPAGDDMLDVADSHCQVHYLYGEEFFGTVATSMFTSFRFMLGDYSTRGGKSLAVAFSQGYGWGFEVIFVAWMIVVIFGLFNIITAIFVDSTISGLKHNDVRRKYAQQYEREYVRSKLKELLSRIQHLHKAKYERNRLSGTRLSRKVIEPRIGTCLPKSPSSVGRAETREIELNEEDFVEIMQDPEVAALLQDLDISMFNPAGLFHTFDPNADGKVSLQELVQAIMKLRGEPQKGDIIAAWVSIRALHEKFDDVVGLLTQSQQSQQSQQQLFQDTFQRPYHDALPHAFTSPALNPTCFGHSNASGHAATIAAGCGRKSTTVVPLPSGPWT